MTGLRERRHAQTRQAIHRAAFTLFRELGFANTTMELIAERAGVSRSTAYRRFTSKENIVLEVPRGWLVAWDEAIASADPSETLADLMAAGCLAVAAEIDSSSDSVLAAYQALSESPVLQSSGAATTDWLERMVALVSAHAPDLSSFDSLTIAGAYMGAIDTMMMRWALSGGKTSVVDATGRVLERLHPILP